ncbi:hypothetical protein F6X53_24260 [Methylobacterium soli]|uniref:DUF3551 domain-containing protein n=1 Tax=Methylobacterium soli TaxID=553447 RepID=A0A6L3SW12_9HYPH|nr:hypothetical protein F6X53_24260 [Methylobacterium soli]
MRNFTFGRKIHRVALGIIAGFAVAMTAAAADAGSCYGVSDPEARTWCLAKAHQQPSACYAIQDSTMRSMCLAEVRK